MNLLILIKKCLNEFCSSVWVGKHFLSCLLLGMVFKRDALSPLLLNFALEYSISRVQVNQDD